MRNDILQPSPVPAATAADATGQALAVAPGTLIIVDDHPLFRSALRAAVTQLVPGARIVEADSAEALDRAVAEHPAADLILLDLRMPGVQGFSALISLRSRCPGIPVIVVSAVEEALVMRRALDFGASGYIPKSAGIETIGRALRTVLEGGVWLPPEMPDLPEADTDRGEQELALRISSLTPQQFRVLMMLADGRLNKQIGADLNVSEATIKAHVTAILRKLGLYRRTQAAVLAQRLLRVEGGPLAPPAAGAEEDSD